MVIANNYAKVLDEFRNSNEHKPIYVFAVLKMDEFVDKWSVLICIDWINSDNRKRVFNSFIKSLQNNLSKEEMSEIARVSFYTPDEHLMKLFAEKFSTGQHIKEDAKVNGNTIHEGYIILIDKGLNSSQSEESS